MFGAWYNLKRNGFLNRNESFQFIITCVFIAFAFFWNWWRNNSLTLAGGFFFFIAFFLVACLLLGIHVLSQKLKAAQMGYKTTYGYWIPGLLVGLLLNVLSSGFLIFFVPGTLDAELVDRERIGKFRGRFRYVDLVTMSVFGPIANILMILILKQLYFATGAVKGSFPYALILMSVMIGLYALIPYPHSTGMNMFRAMRWSLVWAWGIGLSYALLIIYANTFSYVLAFIIGLIVLI
jgi:hypothetical protein